MQVLREKRLFGGSEPPRGYAWRHRAVLLYSSHGFWVGLPPFRPEVCRDGCGAGLVACGNAHSCRVVRSFGAQCCRVRVPILQLYAGASQSSLCRAAGSVGTLCRIDGAAGEASVVERPSPRLGGSDHRPRRSRHCLRRTARAQADGRAAGAGEGASAARCRAARCRGGGDVCASQRAGATAARPSACCCPRCRCRCRCRCRRGRAGDCVLGLWGARRARRLQGLLQVRRHHAPAEQVLLRGLPPLCAAARSRSSLGSAQAQLLCLLRALSGSGPGQAQCPRSAWPHGQWCLCSGPGQG